MLATTNQFIFIRLSTCIQRSVDYLLIEFITGSKINKKNPLEYYDIKDILILISKKYRAAYRYI